MFGYCPICRKMYGTKGDGVFHKPCEHIKKENKMKSVICGGNLNTGKESGIIVKINDSIKCDYMFNGSMPVSISECDLVLWFPDISNDMKKVYPIKDKGSVLICSKVMREGYTKIDAVSRIFNMNGNAVIAIYKDDSKQMRFELIDALGNVWCNTSDISILSNRILDIYHWTKASVRKSLKKIKDIGTVPISERFLDLNKKIAKKVVNGCGERYFGNYSTRCMSLFPSIRFFDQYLFSPRNVDKREITVNDMVLCTKNEYFGERKPSVDAPVQIEIYEQIPGINYMIHGHAYIENAPTTENYYPCGDLREVDEVVDLMRKGHKIINLKNHGFIIAGRHLVDISNINKSVEFKSLN